MKKLAWKSVVSSMNKSWEKIQEPTVEQLKKFNELEEPQKNWLRVSNVLYPVIRNMLIEMDKQNTVVRSELNTVYKDLKSMFKKIKHVNRRK